MAYVQYNDLLLALFDEVRAEPEPHARLEAIAELADQFGSLASESAVEAVRAARLAGTPIEEIAGILGIPITRLRAMNRVSRKGVDNSFDASEIIERGLRKDRTQAPTV